MTPFFSSNSKNGATQLEQSALRFDIGHDSWSIKTNPTLNQHLVSNLLRALLSSGLRLNQSTARH
jgi:hypothetical protein